MPIKHLTIADGLPQNSVNKISQDRKGFFWIGTNGGLSRFDGHDFVNFTQLEGLPRNEVLDFLETRDGEFWLATRGGLVQFTPDGKVYDHSITEDEAARLPEKPMFVTFPLPNAANVAISKLIEDSRGTIWIGTERGLFQRLKNANRFDFLPVNINLSPNESSYIYALYEDRSGAIWVGTGNNLIRISDSNHIATYRNKNGAVIFNVILEDRAGNFWVGTQHQGLFQFSVDADGTPKITKQFAAEPDSEVEWIDAIAEFTEGRLWIGGTNGLYEFEPKEGKLFRYTRSSGLSYYRFQTIFEDRDGDLWLGTRTNGIYQLSTKGLISFETEDRISFVPAVGLDNENNLILTAFVTNTELDKQGARVSRDITKKSVRAFEWRFGKLDVNGFSWIVPMFSQPVAYYGWGSNQLSFQARNGEWWIATGKGLFRYPKADLKDLKKIVPINVFDENSGLNPSDVFRIFEDSHGDICIATSGENSNGFYKWERATETLRDMTATKGFSAVKSNLISSFAEDRAGNLWVGFYSQGFARFRDGQFDFWGDEKGVLPGGISSLYFDRENRLWLATRQGGILQVDNPQAEILQFINYTVANGLSSNRTLSLTQDKQGFIYIGTDRDINRLNPQTKEFKQLNLAKNQLQREYRSAVCDGSGTLWFGTTEGLVKYLPTPDKLMKPPEILITGVLIEGARQKISAMGATELNLPALAAEQNQMRIDYVSLSNFEDENIRYQYKFEEDADWSLPNKERFINFANLSWGSYHVQIRAIASGGVTSEHPAVVSFRILPPIYLRSWFLALVLLLTGAGFYALYRFRLRQLLEVERARTLIATDLHDDIGSNLSKISVLSEVVRIQLANKNESNNKLLTSIAEISRESVSSMSDIVWAINPKRDSVLEMIRRMREHAETMFVPKGVAVHFSEPAAGSKIKLSMNLRRELYLIFKEAVNNAAKHSNCTSITIVFRLEKKEFFLEIADNGCGFYQPSETNGNGLSNMQARVQKLRGQFKVDSEVNRGTTIKIQIPQS